MMRTEQELRDWRNGQTQAERLTAGLLYLEGYSSIDPQHPLGGPDGLKDVLFEREGKRWIAAAYFPATAVGFNEIRTKFLHDLAGVSANGCQGIAFFVNKAVTISERKSLIESAMPHETEIFHLERIRAMLDSPRGCGLRLEYLHLPMSEEEQWAFWQAMNSKVMETLVESDKRLRQMDSKLDRILARTQSLEFGITELKSSLETSTTGTAAVLPPSGSITPSILQWIHRLITEDSQQPEIVRGRFRSVQVWVAGAGVEITKANYVAPPANEIPHLVENLLTEWRSGYSRLIGAPRDSIIEAIARFHHEFLSIHPFLDGNGRVARALSDQAVHELIGMRISDEIIRDKKMYFDALEQADRGNLVPLITLFQAALSTE